MNLADLLSRITNLLDAETDPADLLYPWHDAMDWTAEPVPEVVEPPESVDITRALLLTDTGRYANLTDAEKLAVLDILNRLDTAYPPEDVTPPCEETDPIPDAMRGRGQLGFRWL